MMATNDKDGKRASGGANAQLAQPAPVAQANDKAETSTSKQQPPLTVSQRRLLAIQKLAKVFGNNRTNRLDIRELIAAEKHSLRAIKRVTNESHIAQICQRRLAVIRGQTSDFSYDSDDSDDEYLVEKDSFKLTQQQRKKRSKLRSKQLYRYMHRAVSGVLPADLELLTEEFWLQVSKWEEIYAEEAEAAQREGAPYAAAAGSRENLIRHGYCVAPPTTSGCAPEVAAITRAIDMLAENGWHPAFVWMLPGTWKYASRMFDLANELTAPGETQVSGDVTMEPTPFAWKLRPGGRTKTDRGGNFPLPHRDYAHDEVFEPGVQAPAVLSVWIPVVDVNASSGCMYMLPRGDDVLFDKPNHAAHMRAALPADDDDSDAEREAAEGTSDDDSKESGQDATNADSFVDDPEVIKTIETRFPFHRCVPVAPLGAGTAVAWAGNTLHWGSSCAAEPPPHVFPPAPPRRSIAFTFRRSGAKVHRASSREGPITRSEAEAGVPDIERRFRIVMQSIVLYSQWIDMSLCVPREYCLETSLHESEQLRHARLREPSM